MAPRKNQGTRATKPAEAKATTPAPAEPKVTKDTQPSETPAPDHQPGTQGDKPTEAPATATPPAGENGDEAKDTQPSETPASELPPGAQDVKPAADTPPAGADGAQDIPALWVEAVSEQGRWRLGFQFTREGVGIALDGLSEAEVAALKGDPMLRVKEVAFSDDPDALVSLGDAE